MTGQYPDLYRQLEIVRRMEFIALFDASKGQVYPMLDHQRRYGYIVPRTALRRRRDWKITCGQ